MFEPLVSIIMPLYNAEKYISHAIESVINQTYKTWELLIVNDGSTDDSLHIAKSFEYKKIKIFAQLNRGASAARNYGLREAQGEYIQFLDADDLLSVNKIAEQLKLLEQHPGKIAYCPTVHFFDGEDYLSKEIIRDIFHVHHESPVEFLINLYGGYADPGGMVQPNAWLTPSNVIEKSGMWDERLNPNPDDDGEYFCRVILNSDGVVYADNAVNYYRKFQNGVNLSRQYSRDAFENRLKSAESKKDQILSKTNSLCAKKALARSFRELEVITYPRYADLSRQAKINIDMLGGTDYVPGIGGAAIERIKNFMGWKFAKWLQFHWGEFKK